MPLETKETVDIQTIQLFFKKAAIEAAQQKEDKISADDFFQAQTTPNEKSLHTKWQEYVKTFADQEHKESEHQKTTETDKLFFKKKYDDLFRQEYKKWFSGAEKNFVAAKIFKDRYDQYEFCLIAECPVKYGEPKPVHRKIYFKKNNDNKLIHVVLNDLSGEAVTDTLDISVEGDITVEWLEQQRAAISNALSEKKQAFFGQQAFDRYLTLIPKDSELIPQVTITGKDLCIPGYENYKYYLTKLDPHDPRLACIGKYLNNCESLLNMDGHQRTVYAIEKPNSGFYAICEMRGKKPDLRNDSIVAGTWAWRNQERTNTTLVLDAIATLALKGAGRINRTTVGNEDIWVVFFLHLANHLTAQKINGIEQVNARLDELHIKNIGGITNRSIHYPEDYTPYEDGNLNDDLLIRYSFNHQTVLAAANIPLHLLYILCNDQLALAPDTIEKLQNDLCNALEKDDELTTHLIKLVKQWHIEESALSLAVPTIVLHTLYSIAAKLRNPNQTTLRQALDQFFTNNGSTLLVEASKSPLLQQWWLETASRTLPENKRFKTLLKLAIESGNMTILNHLMTEESFAAQCNDESNKIMVDEKKVLDSYFDDSDDFESINLSPAGLAIKYQKFEILSALIAKGAALTKEDLDIAIKYLEYYKNENAWLIFQCVLDKLDISKINDISLKLKNFISRLNQSLTYIKQFNSHLSSRAKDLSSLIENVCKQIYEKIPDLKKNHTQTILDRQDEEKATGINPVLPTEPVESSSNSNELSRNSSSNIYTDYTSSECDEYKPNNDTYLTTEKEIPLYEQLVNTCHLNNELNLTDLLEIITNSVIGEQNLDKHKQQLDEMLQDFKKAINQLDHGTTLYTHIETCLQKLRQEGNSSNDIESIIMATGLAFTLTVHTKNLVHGQSATTETEQQEYAIYERNKVLGKNIANRLLTRNPPVENYKKFDGFQFAAGLATFILGSAISAVGTFSFILTFGLTMPLVFVIYGLARVRKKNIY